jgi:hypothetical protein
LTEKLFKKYKLKIKEFSYHGYICDNERFPNEKKFREVRVELGQIHDKEHLKDMYGCDSLNTYNSNLDNYYRDKNSLKYFKEDLKKVENEIPYKVDNNLEFSFFIKYEEDLILSIDNMNYVYQAYESAFFYMSFLMSTMSQVYNEKRFDYLSAFIEFTDSYKDVLSYIDLNITNNNIEDVQSISYRLYKDYKFFYELREYLREGTYEQFIYDFEYIINNIDDENLEENILNICSC